MNPPRRWVAPTAAIAFSLCGHDAIAAQRVDLKRLDISAVNRQYTAAAARMGVAREARERHAEMLGIEPESALRVLRTRTDADGTRHTRYQQTFRGTPVWGEQVVVSERRDGTVRGMFGRMVNGLAREVPTGAPGFTSTNALALGRSAGLGNRLGFMRTRNEQAEQVIYVDDHDRAHLAYVVSYFADTAGGGSPTRPFVIVDANNGRILKQWDALAQVLVGTGPGGNLKTGQYEYGTGSAHPYLDVTQSVTEDGLTCTMENAHVRTVSLYVDDNSMAAWSYPCFRNHVRTINGAYSPLNDAHHFGNVVHNMYNAYTGGNPLTSPIILRVHYGLEYDGAHWDGGTATFGDGKDMLHPLVSADTVGHEVSHGYTQQHSGLLRFGQSGGISEAFSDMAGEATEYYWKGRNDFDVGRDILKRPNAALRYMCQPTADGTSIDHASQYTTLMSVHGSAGVYNKAFCMLARTAGWDTPHAFRAFARANALYWTPLTDFNDGACGVEIAARELGLDRAAVTAAFRVVGVACDGTVIGTPASLTRGVPVGGLAGKAGDALDYTLYVPVDATNLTFAMTGGTGDADLYVKHGSAPSDTSFDCRPYLGHNNETCTFVAPSAGTWHVRVKGYSNFSGVSLVANYLGRTYSNYSAVAIRDHATVETPITISGRPGNGPAKAEVAVVITHTFIGDLLVELIAPDGSPYRLHNFEGGSADNINKLYTVDLSGESMNGTWKLRVQDRVTHDAGTLNGWSLTL